MTNIEIDFLEAVNGCQKSIQFVKMGQCQTCDGSKKKPGSEELICGECDGLGIVKQRFSTSHYEQKCPACNGDGTIIQKCITCSGKGYTHTNAKETITIPRGVDNGMTLRVTKMGNYSAKGENGDLLIKVKVRDHPYFERKGKDIYTDKYITMTQTILGGKVNIDTIAGRQ